MYLVTKRFNDGIQRLPGELVEGTGYKLLSKLISLRYLKEINPFADTSFRCQLCSDERIFIDQETLDKHYIDCHPDEIEIVNENDDKEKPKSSKSKK